jgi:hypothetical protein
MCQDKSEISAKKLNHPTEHIHHEFFTCLFLPSLAPPWEIQGLMNQCWESIYKFLHESAMKNDAYSYYLVSETQGFRNIKHI